MHARVAAFEGDISRIDELIGIIRERMSAGEEIPGAKRFLMLIDRGGGSTLGITFFDSEESIRTAEPIFEKMGDEVPEELRGSGRRSRSTRWRSTTSPTVPAPHA